tara:strand:- start:5526 stop:5993 length:468 start_codon:yes stop_codon:yes gene_type:complete
METTNSDDKELQSADIIVKVLDQIGVGDMSIATALAIIAKEGTLDTADTVQFGNTVFLANRGVGANKNKMVGRAFNVDTGKNYLNNCLEYMEYLRKKGITHFNTSFSGSEVLKLMQLIQRMIKKNTDSRVYIGEDAKGDYLVYFKVGKDPIPRIA